MIIAWLIGNASLFFARHFNQMHIFVASDNILNRIFIADLKFVQLHIKCSCRKIIAASLISESKSWIRIDLWLML